jgi:phospholipid-binding lipoprotein MlaA
MRLLHRAFCRRRIDLREPTTCLVLLLFLFLGCSVLHAASDDPTPSANTDADLQGVGNAVEQQTGSGPAATAEKPSDEYGNVTEEEASRGDGPQIADPIEPWNRAMYHVNDKVYFWLLKPAATGYKHVVNEDFRALFSNFYKNISAPIRIVNNFLQGKPGYAGIEFARFLINSIVGVGGLRDCAKECFGINGRDADFGQTLGKYGVGFGFYIVWPVLGPSSPRDTVGWVGDWLLRPQTYVSSQAISYEGTGLYVHEKTNYTSFHLGDYEALKQASIDPYVAMRDAYVQYRKKLIEQ